MIWNNFKKLIKSKLKKGIKRRLFPFNPITDVDSNIENTLALRDWINYGNAHKELSFQEIQDSKEAIDEINTNAKKRGLINLSKYTQTRIHPETGERQYLLHRGVSNEENSKVLIPSSQSSLPTYIQHDSKSSWTPHFKTARSFSKTPSKSPGSPAKGSSEGHVLSAWINEKDIHHIPMQYGNIDEFGTVQGNPIRYRHEFEIIVKPHKSEVAKIEQKLTPEQALHHRIGLYADEKGAVGSNKQRFLDPYEKRVMLNRLKDKLGLSGPYSRDSAKKLAVSEKESSLQKTPVKSVQKNWKKEGYKLLYRAPTDGDSRHFISAYSPKGELIGKLHAEDLNDGTFQTELVKVHPLHQRKGIATAMYSLMENKTGLKAIPDLEAQTAESKALWSQPKRPFGIKKSVSATSRYRYSLRKNLTGVQAGEGLVQKGSISLLHYSPKMGLKEIDPKFARTGADKNVKHHQTEHPHSFYYRKGTSLPPSDVHVWSGARKYEIEIPDDTKLYDIGSDPQQHIKQLHEFSKQKSINPGVITMDDIHGMLKELGYHGFYNSNHTHLSNVVGLYHSQPVKKEG